MGLFGSAQENPIIKEVKELEKEEMLTKALEKLIRRAIELEVEAERALQKGDKNRYSDLCDSIYYLSMKIADNMKALYIFSARLNQKYGPNVFTREELELLERMDSEAEILRNSASGRTLNVPNMKKEIESRTNTLLKEIEKLKVIEEKYLNYVKKHNLVPWRL